jgi:hypothetical protein
MDGLVDFDNATPSIVKSIKQRDLLGRIAAYDVVEFS